MHSRKRLLIKLLIGVGVLGICGAGAFFILRPMLQPSKSVTSTNTVAGDWRQKAQQLAYSGDVDGAIKLYDEQLKIASSADEREAILIGKVQYLLQATRNDAAYSTAQQAVTNKADASSYGILGDTQVAKGLKAEAVASYKKALSLSDQSGRRGRSSGGAAYYQSRIQELGG